MAQHQDRQRCAVVLGGTGWVGRHIGADFAGRGYRLVVLARNPSAVPGAGKGVSVDLTSATPCAVADILMAESTSVVVNATDGANATDGWDLTETQLTRSNVDLVTTLLRAIRLMPERPRLVHMGTIHEYGPVAAGTVIDEATPPRPTSAYARTKLAGSTAVLDAAQAGLVDAVVLRAVNVCGPHPSPASLPGKLLSLLEEAARSGTLPISIAPAWRDFVDVRDLADAVVRAAERPGLNRAINIGGGVAIALREFVTLFVTQAGFPASIIEDQANPVHSLGGDWVQADIRLARQLLGWSPRTPLAESLRHAWKTFRADTASPQEQ